MATALSPSLPPIHDKKHIPALDGLRGFALVLVITFHYFGQNYPVFALGWTGLDLFFVLSGYLITGRIVYNANKPNRYIRFYRNRALRILPLYYLVLIVYYFSIFFIISPANFHRFDFFLDNWGAFVFCLQNWAYIFNEPPPEIHLAHLWSLAIEEQFYLIWPFIVYTFCSRRHFISALWVAVCGVILYRCWLFFFNGAPDPYYAYNYNTFCRLDGLLIGAITFFSLHTRPVKSKFILLLPGLSILILIAGFVITRNVRHTSIFVGTFGYTAFSFIFAGLIYIICTRPYSYANRFFKMRMLQHFGKISYGFYVAHWPMLVILYSRLTLFIQNHFSIPVNIAQVLALVMCLLLSYLFGLASYTYFERYFLKQKG